MRRRMRQIRDFAQKVQIRKFDARVDAYVEFAQIFFSRNCAYCAKFGVDLQLYALGNHFFAPCIRAFRRLGKLEFCNPDLFKDMPLLVQFAIQFHAQTANVI